MNALKPIGRDWLKPHVNWIPWGDGQYPKFVVLRNILSSPDFSNAAQDDLGEQCCTFNFSFSDTPDRDDLDAVESCTQDIMGNYYPVALWCYKATFRAGIFKACLIDGQRHLSAEFSVRPLKGTSGTVRALGLPRVSRHTYNLKRSVPNSIGNV